MKIYRSHRTGAAAAVTPGLAPLLPAGGAEGYDRWCFEKEVLEPASGDAIQWEAVPDGDILFAEARSADLPV